MRVSVGFQIIPRPVGRLGLGLWSQPHVVKKVSKQLNKLKKHAVCRPIRRIAGAVKVTEWLLILIGPSVEECFKSG